MVNSKCLKIYQFRTIQYNIFICVKWKYMEKNILNCLMLCIVLTFLSNQQDEERNHQGYKIILQYNSFKYFTSELLKLLKHLNSTTIWLFQYCTSNSRGSSAVRCVVEDSVRVVLHGQHCARARTRRTVIALATVWAAEQWVS